MANVRVQKYDSLCVKCWRSKAFNRVGCVKFAHVGEVKLAENVGMVACCTGERSTMDSYTEETMSHFSSEQKTQEVLVGNDKHNVPEKVFCGVKRQHSSLRMETRYYGASKLQVQEGDTTDTTELYDSESLCDDIDSENDMEICSEGDGTYCEDSTVSEMSIEGNCSVEFDFVDGEGEIEEECSQVSMASTSSSSTEDVFYRCDNCRRESLLSRQDETKELDVELVRIAISGLNFRHSWKTISRAKLSKTRTHVTLCLQCKEVLQERNETGKRINQFASIWPVYVWKFITHPESLARYGGRVLHFIPRQWWRFWKKSLIWEYHDYFRPEYWSSYKDEPVVVIDQTFAKRRYAQMQSNLCLGEIQQVCDDLLMPCVLCPWGCSGYRHDAGCIAFDAVMTRYFPYVVFFGRLSSSTEVRNVQSAREDYFSSDIQMHLFNPSWTVNPSVYFDKTLGPVFLTCDDHRGGTKDRYFHLPRSHSCLPPLFGDQLSHVVLRSRTLHQTKAKQYSNTYQMNLFMGNYSGVDSTWVSDIRRRFDFQSHISLLYEAQSYANRADIRGLVTRLGNEGSLSHNFAMDLQKNAEELFPASEPYGDGSTMMTLYDCICLQKMLVGSIYVDIEYGGKRHVQRKWPLYLIRVHPNNRNGARFPRLPTMKDTESDSRILWFLSMALLGVNVLWEMTASNVTSISQWHGFVLTFLTRTATEYSFHMRDKMTNPFCIPRTHSLGKASGLCALLSEHAGISPSVYDLTGFELLYKKEKADGRIMFLKFRFMKTLIVEEECSVLWFINKERRSNISRLPLQLCYGDAEFQLRFISYSERVKLTDVNSWDGGVYLRHGGSQFTSWWHCPRRSRSVSVSLYDSFPWKNLDMAIYVRSQQTSLETYRREYLKYIGGQSHVICKRHDIPLIIAPKKTQDKPRVCGRKRGNLWCQSAQTFACPILGCRSRMCKTCFSEMDQQACSYISHVDGTQSGRAQRSQVDQADNCDLYDSCSEESHCTDTKSTATSSTVETPYAVSYDELSCDRQTGSLSDDSAAQFESDSESIASEHVDPYIAADKEDTTVVDDFCHFQVNDGIETDLCVGDQMMGIGTGECAPGNCLDDVLEGLPIISTTHTHSEPMTAYGALDSIGTSVLLNKCGSLLVRKQSRLQASRQQMNVVQRVVAQQDVGTVPLVYLEGLLFPSIFWKLVHDADGSITGSIPTALYCQHKSRKNLGIATLASHAKQRLKLVETPASTDPRYLCFLFDTLANGAIEGHDTRIVMSRGFESCMGPAGMRLRDKDDDLYSDGIDNRQNVHNLCAAEREQPSTLFLTMTCNQSRHFGVRQIKQYLDSGEALVNYKRFLKNRYPNLGELSPREESEVNQSLCESARNLILRNWMELKHLLLTYLLKSKECPLNAKVLRIFCRDEYQSDTGNLPHMHMLITLLKGYDTEEGRVAIEALIRGFVDDIVTEEEVPSYIQEGIFKDYSDYEAMKEDARKFLPHHHSERCMRRTGPGKYDLRCRVPDTRYISGDIARFFEANLAVRRSKEALVVLQRLELVAIDGDNEPVPQREYLESKRIYAPARYGEGNITPVVGRLFASTRSTMNAQICTSHGTTRYVVKYVIKIDENNYVAFSSRPGDSALKAEKVFLHNTKITSSARNEHKRLQESRHNTKPRGRAVASTEMMQIILGKPQVFCNMEFIRVPTLPLGERSGVERRKPTEQFKRLVEKKKIETNLDSFEFMVPLVRKRSQMFPEDSYRQHTKSQVLMLKDQMICPVTLDRVFIFSIRPPELLSIDKMEWYFKFFERSEETVFGDEEKLSDLLTQSLHKSAFIDGMSHRIRIRVQAIPKLQDLLTTQEFRTRFYDRDAKAVLVLLDKICNYYSTAGIGDIATSSLTKAAQKDWKHLQEMFTTQYDVEKPLPIIVFSNVKPQNACKFAVHLLLSLGHFETERDLWISRTMRESFTKAGLLSGDTTVPLSEQIDLLLKLWIEDQLRYYPIGSTTMDEYIISAERILRALIIDNTVPIDEVPPVMYTALLQHTDAKIATFMEETKASMVEATLKTLEEAYPRTSSVDLLPTHSTLMSTTRSLLPAVLWNQNLPRTSSQSRASYREQAILRDDLIARVEEYRRGGRVQPKNILIAGPPGVGKTHCLSQSVCYSLSRGLCVMSTAILAERAFLLGGKHIHMLFKLKPRTKGTPHRLAELAVIALQKHVEFLALLRCIDVLYIDECGQISAELLAVLDIILRKIRNSDLFMGGILIIGTIDQVQLRPIDGLPFLLSPYILTCFRMHVLQCYVRCADCTALQKMNTLSRNLSCDQSTRKRRLNRLRKLVSENCTFVTSWDDPLITEQVLRIFPHRADAFTAVQRFLKKKRETSNLSHRSYYTISAADEMVAMESHADWKPANDIATSLLDHDCREPKTLDLYSGAVYQFTYNCPGRFKTTQLGVLLHVPEPTITDSFREFDIYVAPAGTKTATYAVLTEECLLASGYRKTKVGIAPNRPRQVWKHGMKIRRTQYALKHHIASTVHSSIGHTVTQVATQLTAENCIWERAMVVVLISRVRRAKDLIFVGDKEANIEALIQGLQRQNQYDEFMEHVVEIITGTRTTMEPLFLGLHPFRFKDIPLPQDRSGVVYLLVSIKDTASIYIGQTNDLSNRINSHNSGTGAIESAPEEKRPWGIYAYIAGFGGDRSLMRQVEARWQNIVHTVKPNCPKDAVALGQRMIQQYYYDREFVMVVADDK